MTDLDLDAHDLDLPELDVPAGDLGAVVARGRSRRRRRRVGGALVATLAVVSAGTVTLTRAGDDDGTAVRIADSGSHRGEVPMDWEAIDPASGLGFTSDLAGVPGGAPLYALSTAAGTADLGSANPKRVVWRSEDGVEWTAARTLGGDLNLADLSTAGNRLYAVGTGAATAAGGPSPLFVGWSDDGAASWQRAGLDLDLAAVQAVSRSSGVTASDVASSDKGTVAVVVLSAQLDVRKVLPDGVSATNGWTATAEGIDLLGTEEPSCDQGEEKGQPAARRGGGEHDETSVVSCFDGDRFIGLLSPQEAYGVTASYSWAELGIAGDALRAVRRQPIAVFAEPGSSDFRRIDLPLDRTAYDVLLDDVDDGFDLAVTVPEGDRSETSDVTLLHSEDGRSWTPSSTDTGLEWVTAMGRLDGRPAMIGQTSSGGGQIVRSNGDGTWTSTRLTDLVDPSLTEDATAHVVAADIGPLGAVIATVVINDREKPSELTPRLLVSRDGTTWSDTSVADLTDGRKVRGVTRVLISGDQVLVTVGLVAPDGDRPVQTVLRGRPA